MKNAGGEITGFRCVAVEVTDRIHAEEALQEAKDAAGDRQSRQKRIPGQHCAAHEIRTPMNAIIGFSNLALKTDLDPKQKDYVSKINNAGISLSEDH